MKRYLAITVGLAVFLAACASSEDERVPTSKGVPTPGQEVFPVVASSEIVVGDNRIQIGLLANNDAPIRSPKTTLQVGFVGPREEEPSSRATMPFL